MYSEDLHSRHDSTVHMSIKIGKHELFVDVEDLVGILWKTLSCLMCNIYYLENDTAHYNWESWQAWCIGVPGTHLSGYDKSIEFKGLAENIETVEIEGNIIRLAQLLKSSKKPLFHFWKEIKKSTEKFQW